MTFFGLYMPETLLVITTGLPQYGQLLAAVSRSAMIVPPQDLQV